MKRYPILSEDFLGFERSPFWSRTKIETKSGDRFCPTLELLRGLRRIGSFSPGTELVVNHLGESVVRHAGLTSEILKSERPGFLQTKDCSQKGRASLVLLALCGIPDRFGPSCSRSGHFNDPH